MSVRFYLDLETLGKIKIGKWITRSIASYCTETGKIFIHLRNIPGWKVVGDENKKVLSISYRYDCRVRIARYLAHEFCHQLDQMRQPTLFRIFAATGSPVNDEVENGSSWWAQLKTWPSRLCYYLNPTEIHARYFTWKRWKAFYFALWGAYPLSWLEHQMASLAFFQFQMKKGELVVQLNQLYSQLRE